MTDKRKQQIDELVRVIYWIGGDNQEDCKILRSLLEDLKGETDKSGDADKLRTLAKWFDVHDSGIPQNSGDEVQRDLLRIADYLAPTSIPSK